MKRKSRKTRRSASKKGFKFGFGMVKKVADLSVKLPGILIISEFFYDDIARLCLMVWSLLAI